MSSPIVESWVWRADYLGNRVEDISDIIMDLRATCNPDNDQTWQMDATVSWRDYRTRLTPYEDWIFPEMRVTWPDGTVRAGRLGLYLVIESPAQRGEDGGTVRLRAMDPLWLVARQGFARKLPVYKGEQKDVVLRRVLDETVLSHNPGGGRRFAIPDTNQAFKKAHEWPRDTNRLEMCNELAQGMGCYNLWTAPHGVIVTRRMGEARLSAQTPVRTYSANVPPRITLGEWQQPLGGVASEVVGAVDTSPFDDSLLNEILICNDDPDLPRINVRGEIRGKGGKNPRSVFKKNGRTHSRKIYNPVLDDDATAKQVANALLEGLSTKNRTARLTVLPDPQPDFARAVVDCLIWDSEGYEVARGRYAVHQVEYNLLPRNNAATMMLDIGRIDNIDDGST